MTIDINENTVFTIDDFHKIKAHADAGGEFYINSTVVPDYYSYADKISFFGHKITMLNFPLLETEYVSIVGHIVTKNMDITPVLFALAVQGNEIRFNID